MEEVIYILAAEKYRVLFSGAHPNLPPLDLPLVKGIIVNYFQNNRKGKFSGNPSSGHPADEIHFGDELKKFCTRNMVTYNPKWLEILQDTKGKISYPTTFSQLDLLFSLRG